MFKFLLSKLCKLQTTQLIHVYFTNIMTFMTYNMTYITDLHEVECSWLLVIFDISVYGLPCVNLNLLLLEMLYLIGLGLGDVKDISVKGLEIVKHAKEVYLESYTSILTVGKDALVNIGIKILYEIFTC